MLSKNEYPDYLIDKDELAFQVEFVRGRVLQLSESSSNDPHPLGIDIAVDYTMSDDMNSLLYPSTLVVRRDSSGIKAYLVHYEATFFAANKR